MSTAPTQVSHLTVSAEATVAHLTLTNPPLNIIDLPMMDELISTLAQVESQPDISTVVLTGAGKCFSAGVDAAAHTPDKVSIMLQKVHSIIRALVSTRKITIARVDGHCLGGGAELAMVCDLVYTSEGANWGFPEIQLGCFPPVAVTALAALIGHKHAADLILTGRTINGSEAASIGLATQAVPAGDLTSAVDRTVQRLAGLSSAALAVTKKAIYAWDSIHFDKGLARAEKIYFDELMKTEDAQEGIRAFLEKRSPQWTGR